MYDDDDFKYTTLRYKGRLAYCNHRIAHAHDVMRVVLHSVAHLVHAYLAHYDDVTVTTKNENFMTALFLMSQCVAYRSMHEYIILP